MVATVSILKALNTERSQKADLPNVHHGSNGVAGRIVPEVVLISSPVARRQNNEGSGGRYKKAWT